MEIGSDLSEGQILLAELAEARDDERTMFAIFATVLSVALGLVIAMGALLFRTCLQGSKECLPGGDLTPVPVWAYLGAPVLPAALLSFALILSTLQTLRSYYLRTIEVRLQDLKGTSIGPPELVKEEGSETQSFKPLPMPSWSHVSLDVMGQGRATRLNRLNWALLYFLISVMLASFITLSLTRIDGVRLVALAVIIDIFLLAVPTALGISNAHLGSRAWTGAQQRLDERLTRTRSGFKTAESTLGIPEVRSKERSLGSFLVLPRVQEELLKALLLPAAAIVARVSMEAPPPLGPDFGWYAVLFWFTFELLVYQARYLLNDVRDREVDCGIGTAKKRFPCSRRDDISALRITLLAFVVRLLIAATIAVLVLPTTNWAWAWQSAMLAAVFIIALPYEHVRSHCVKAAEMEDIKRRDALARRAVALVGFGYGLRVLAGFWIVGVRPGLVDKAELILLLGFLGASLFGSSFVAATWALESTRSHPNELGGKAHLQYFAASLGRWGCAWPFEPSRRILKPTARLWAPYAAHAAGATAALLVTWSLLVQGSPFDASVVWLLGIALFACVISVYAPLPAGRITLLLGLLFFVGAGIFGEVSVGALAAGAVFGFVSATTLTQFRTLRWTDLPNFSQNIAGGVLVVLNGLFRWFTVSRAESARIGSKTQTNHTRRTAVRAENAAAALQQIQPGSIVLVDIEGTLSDWSPSATEVNEELRRFLDAAAARGLSGDQILFVSNATAPADHNSEHRVFWRATKPAFDLPEDLERGEKLVVIGDQILTDGRLARRIDASFYYVAERHRAPWWPRLQRHAGELWAHRWLREGVSQQSDAPAPPI